MKINYLQVGSPGNLYQEICQPLYEQSKSIRRAEHNRGDCERVGRSLQKSYTNSENIENMNQQYVKINISCDIS